MDAGRLPDQVTLIKALDRWRSEWEAQTDPFVAHLTTWLNNGRWDTGEDVAQAQADWEAGKEINEEWPFTFENYELLDPIVAT